ncbi:MAG: glycosyltransferase involved in cell wall biosynthesis, partial [Saprospiraceae bacterium]
FLMSGDIFILPTFYKSEAFPISILEAMRCGCVILTTKHNYLPYILSGKNGTLIEIQNQDKLLKALQFYARNPEKMYQIQRMNVQTAKNIYTPKKYIQHLEGIINPN